MTQINKNRSEKEVITNDASEFQKIIREFHEKLYASKLDNLEEMNKFIEMYNLPRITQQAENLNRTITRNKTELIIKKLPANKSPRKR